MDAPSAKEPETSQAPRYERDNFHTIMSYIGDREVTKMSYPDDEPLQIYL